MPKIKKQQRAKKYQYKTNRKRLRNKLGSTGNLTMPGFKKLWEKSKTAISNINEMGLTYDINKTIKVPNTKQDRIKILKLINGVIQEEEPKVPELIPDKPKQYVVNYLEEKANTFIESGFRLPQGHVNLLTYYMDKHGRNYKAMSQDRKNENQETWRQIRARIRRFMNIPEQYEVYVQKKKDEGKEIDLNAPEWDEFFSDSEI